MSAQEGRSRPGSSSSAGSSAGGSGRRSRPRTEARLAIPGYELGEVIGRGAAGTVYRALQRAVDREVALKVLHADLCTNDRVVRRLQREARTMARLAHPNVVSAIDMGEVDGRWWYAMELVDGTSLDSRLRAVGRISEREALRLFIPLCEALEHLWDHDVVHRDVKPANILIDRSGRPRLADLGLAVGHDDDPGLTQMGRTLGTPHYISPEQAVDPKSVDIRTDLWSLGATLFHAVCGHPPFAGTERRSTAEVLTGVLHERIPDPRQLEPSLSKGMALVLRKCLTRDLRHRYQTPHELLIDLELLRERRAPRVQARLLDPVRRSSRRAEWTVAAVLCTAALVTGWWFVTSRAVPEHPLVTAPTPYEPLESLAWRAAREPERVGRHLVELGALGRGVPGDQRGRYEAVEQELTDELLRRTRALQEEVDQAVEERLEAGDFAGARAFLEEQVVLRFVESTGLRPGDLAQRDPALPPWLGALSETVSSHTAAALRALESDLEREVRERLADVERFLDEGQWARAWQRLEADEAELVAAVGRESERFPERSGLDAAAPSRIALKLRRQRVEDDWLLLDAELRRWVRQRADRIDAELSAAPTTFDGAGELRAAFLRELERRVLAFESLPPLTRTSFDELERRSRDLGELRSRRQEELARGEFRELAILGNELARRREYDALVALWAETPVLLGEAGSTPAAPPWAEELGTLVELRRYEARLLAGLLDELAQRLRSLDGRRADVWVQDILYPDVLVEVGPDPLRDGFWLEGREDRLGPASLSTADVERWLSLSAVEDLEPGRRLLVSLFRFHEGRPEAARSALRSGRLPSDGTAARLADDLLLRAADAIERADALASDRGVEAVRLLELVFDPERIERSPRTVSARIDRLLREFSDLSAVRARRPELLGIKRGLRRGTSGELSPEEVFRPDRVTRPRPSRVRLDFSFQAAEAGAWELGSWNADGEGWSTPGAETWEELGAQRGPALVLRSPLDADARMFELRLTLEAPDEVGPQLVVVSAAGFQVALAGPALPGAGYEPRWLVGTTGVDELLAGLRAGEGHPVARWIEPGGTHELVLRGSRRSGRLDLDLDGERLGSVHPSPPDPYALGLELRSWGPLRLLQASLETGL